MTKLQNSARKIERTKVKQKQQKHPETLTPSKLQLALRLVPAGSTAGEQECG